MPAGIARLPRRNMSGPSKVLYVRISEELHDKITARADKAGRSIAWTVEDLLLKALGR